MSVEEFEREIRRSADVTPQQDRIVADRLTVVTAEIANLAANMLTGVLNPTLLKLLSDREAEKALLEAKLAARLPTSPTAAILPHPALLLRFQEKVGRLREALDHETICVEAAEILSMLIESVTLYPGGVHGPEAEIVAGTSDLVSFARNENSPLGAGRAGCSVSVGCGDRI